MKKKTILTLALACTMAFSSVVMANEVVKLNEVNAKENVSVTSQTSGDNWSDYFDYVTEGNVTFTPNQKNNNFDGLVYSTDKKAEVGENGVGLGVNITKPTTFTYKNKINVKALSKDINFFEIYANPITPSQQLDTTMATAGDGEVYSFEVRLTDDDGNYIAIKSNFSIFDLRLGWVSAYTEDLSACGWQDKVNRKANQGTPVYFSYSGLSKNTLAYYFDYETMELWASGRFRPGFDEYGENGEYVKATGSKNKELVRSFISKEFLDNGEMPFAGFSSDEVTMTIDFPNVGGPQGANFIFLNIGGNSLVGDKFNDNSAPYVFLNDVDVKNVPVAQKDRFYPLYDYVGYDLIDGDITSAVSLDITDPDGVKLNKSEIQGGFIPTKEGVYKLEYNLADYSGNKAVPVEVNIPVVNAIKFVSMNVEESKFLQNGSPIQNLNNNFITASVGDTINLAPYTCEGGSGTLNSQVTVKDKAGYLPIFNNSFSVVNDGYTVITYTVSDYLGDEVTKTYYVNASYNPTPILDVVFLQDAIKQGSRVNIKIPKAYDYYSVKGVKSEVKVVAEISEDNGATYEKFGGGLYAIKNASTEKLLVKYSAKSLTGNETVEKVYEIKVAKPTGKYNTFAGADYFSVNGDISVSYAKLQGSVYEEAEFTPNTKGSSMQFINPIRDVDANVTFNFEAATAKFNKITVTFNGAYNGAEVVTVVITKNAEGIDVAYVSGSVFNKEAFIYGKNSTLTLKVTADGSLTLNGTALVKIPTYDNGSVFNGFTGNKVFATITYDDFDDGAKVRYTDFGFIPAITKDMEDNINPSITVSENVTTYHDVYETIKIPSATAFDAISPDLNVTFTLVDPNGEILYENVLADKDYYFNLNVFGTYVLKYSSIDESNNKINRSINIVAIDNIAPVIEINGQFKNKYKVGDTVTIPNYIVIDNYYDFVSSYVFVTTPTYGMKTVTVDGEASAYKFQVAGRYVITFYAMDNSANYTVKEFIVYVE